MIQLQFISKILNTGDWNIITANMLDVSYFVGYENEFNFILEHVNTYGNVPDKATFLNKFKDFELVDVTESDEYLVETIKEESLYYKSVPIVENVAKLLQTDANAAAEYMLKAVKDLQPNYQLGGTDIIAQAKERFTKFVDRKEHQNEWFFESGFPELDDLIHGIERQEELFVIYARTNQGKSWIAEAICKHIWQLGFNIGYISPEMSANSVGYRFDTLYKNMSNRGLMWGKDDISNEEYETYTDELSKNEHKFIVSTPMNFSNSITVTKVKNWVKKYNLNAIAIDGIKYMTDERYRRGDNLTTSLTNISEDLMALSVEIKIPVIVVVQANRGAVSSVELDGTPELETIRDSDGIAHNASKVISIHQKKNGVLQIGIKKQRFGPVGGTLNYQWDIDKGKFTFIPTFDDAEEKAVTQEKVRAVKKKYKDTEDVF